MARFFLFLLLLAVAGVVYLIKQTGSVSYNQEMQATFLKKLGGEELNVSSDVDLIYVFSEEGQTDASTPGSRSIDTSTFFTKVGRRIAALLGEVTGDGIVFRVDLRLRPNGDVGPLAVSLGMLEEYFIVQGREWERYAWIKARVVNQAHAQSPESFKQSVRGLHDVVRPFVFRRYLDFNVLAALRELHSQIRQEAARRALGRESHMGGQYPPVDIKLGPGGIREVEFIAQLFQLIRGGKEEPLRARGTREVLTYLSTSGRLDIKEVAMLQEAYQFWRNLEHRLQYLDDAQTHVLPGRAETIAHIADSMGFLNSESFIKALETTQDRVRGSFERLFAGVAADPSPQAASKETKFDRLLIKAKEIASETSNPEQTLSRLTELLEAISRRASYLALFDEYPVALSRVAHVMSALEHAFVQSAQLGGALGLLATHLLRLSHVSVPKRLQHRLAHRAQAQRRRLLRHGRLERTQGESLRSRIDDVGPSKLGRAVLPMCN
jgi:glutamate-ammonia-ligase adenylyltransferase